MTLYRVPADSDTGYALARVEEAAAARGYTLGRWQTNGRYSTHGTTVTYGLYPAGNTRPMRGKDCPQWYQWNGREGKTRRSKAYYNLSCMLRDILEIEPCPTQNQ